MIEVPTRIYAALVDAANASYNERPREEVIVAMHFGVSASPVPTQRVVSGIRTNTWPLRMNAAMARAQTCPATIS